MKVPIPHFLVVVLGACAAPVPEPIRGPQPSAELPRNDWRRQLVGAWTIEFRLDSVRGRGGSVERWQPGSFKTATGSFVIRDSTAAGWGQAVQSTIDVEFDSLLSRPMSCYDPKPTATGIDRDGSEVRLTFTPTSADCGFSGWGRFFGDSLIGEWDESAFAGPSVTGRFRMIRKGP
jgi:hypothetical protein